MDFMNVQEAAERCQVTERAIYDAIKNGLLVAYDIDGNYRIKEEDLEAAVVHGVFD